MLCYVAEYILGGFARCALCLWLLHFGGICMNHLVGYVLLVQLAFGGFKD